MSWYLHEILWPLFFQVIQQTFDIIFCPSIWFCVFVLSVKIQWVSVGLASCYFSQESATAELLGFQEMLKLGYEPKGFERNCASVHWLILKLHVSHWHATFGTPFPMHDVYNSMIRNLHKTTYLWRLLSKHVPNADDTCLHCESEGSSTWSIPSHCIKHFIAEIICTNNPPGGQNPARHPKEKLQQSHIRPMNHINAQARAWNHGTWFLVKDSIRCVRKGVSSRYTFLRRSMKVVG